MHRVSVCEPVYNSCVSTLGPTGPTATAIPINTAFLSDFVSQTQVSFGQVSIKLPGKQDFISYQLYTSGNVASIGIAIAMTGSLALLKVKLTAADEQGIRKVGKNSLAEAVHGSAT